MIANRLTMRASVVRATLQSDTDLPDDPFAPVADLNIIGQTVNAAMPCFIWEDQERAANSDGQIVVRSAYMGQALPRTDIREGDEITGVSRFGDLLTDLPRMQVRSVLSGISHTELRLDALSQPPVLIMAMFDGALLLEGATNDLALLLEGGGDTVLLLENAA